MNNWYNRINGIQPTSSKPQVTQQPIQNPFQQMQYAMNAMRNPVAFVMDQFPDVPENIRNNPNAILNYLQQTRGPQFTQQMQQIAGKYGGK